MKFTTAAIAAFALACPAFAEDVQTAHLTFRGVDKEALYEEAVLADGTKHETGSTRHIALIDAPDYQASMFCDFDFILPPGGETPKTEFTIGDDGHTGQVKITPPTPISSLSCKGYCVQSLGICNGVGTVGPQVCCNGYCAANHCRPWDGV